jgi:hypothetical protein
MNSNPVQSPVAAVSHTEGQSNQTTPDPDDQPIRARIISDSESDDETMIDIVHEVEGFDDDTVEITGIPDPLPLARNGLPSSLDRGGDEAPSRSTK